MKRTLYFLMLVMSVKTPLFAQQTTARPLSGAEKTFELTPEKIKQRFWIDLGKGCRLRLELQEESDINLFSNVDSILLVFLNDMKTFKDSLSDPLPNYRVDYVIDLQGRKKIRIQKIRPEANSFVLDQGEPSALKLDQDTINLVIISKPSPTSYPRWDRGLHYSRLTFLLNQYQDIVNYVTGGLNAKISWLKKNQNSYWVRDNERGYRAKNDLSITGAMPRGNVRTVNGPDYLASTILLNAGNYKNYFVPAFALGMTAHFNRVKATHTVAVLWEPNFLFAHDAKGALQTYRNDFLDLTYGRISTSPGFLQGLVRIDANMTLSYLIHREGAFYDKNTFRLTFGGLSLDKENIRLEPGMYFNNFFRGVTPSLQLCIKL